MNATTTLHSIVKDFQYITGRGDEDYFRLLHMAARALKDVRKFHATRVVTTAESNLSNLTNGVWHYPSDCIGVVDVFYDRGNTLFPAGQRNDIVYHTNDSGSVSDVDDITDYTYWNGGYGVSGGRNQYYFYDDKENRRLIFESNNDEKIWVRYVSTGIGSLGENTIVPEEYQEIIEAYILWQEALKHHNYSKNTVGLYKQAYNQASKRLKAFQSPTLNEWMDVIYSTFRQTPKR